MLYEEPGRPYAESLGIIPPVKSKVREPDATSQMSRLINFFETGTALEGFEGIG